MSNDFSRFLAVARNIPSEWKQAQNLLNWYLLENSNLMNSKTNGNFSPYETPSGNQMVTGADPTNILRKTIEFGALPVSTTKSVAHGIPNIGSMGYFFKIFDLRLNANNPTANLFFCLQYWSLNGADSIRLNMDQTNINVTTTVDYSAYSDCNVVVEYMRGTS